MPLDYSREMGFHPLPDERPTPDTPATSPTVHGNEESGGPTSLGEADSLGDIPISAEYSRAWGLDELQVSLCQAGTWR